MPGNSTANARRSAGQMPGSLTANARQNLQQMPGQNDANTRSNARTIDSQMPEITTGHFTEADQATDWSELWRIERDDDERYRWRLRFSKSRTSKPGGEINSAIKKLIKKRPGKGRHAKSRADAQRLGNAAQYLQNSLRSGDTSWIGGQVNATGHFGGRAGANDSTAERKQVSDVSGVVAWDEMSDLPVM
jgi:hypothetical protein